MNTLISSTAGAKPELLAPAGDMERLKMALAYGADAVYLAGREFGMRASAASFGGEELNRAAELCRAAGAKMYVTCNTMPRGDEIDRLPAFLEQLAEAGADAVIVSDLGVLTLARRYAPQLEIHISTQAGVTNHAAARGWFELGAKRVIPARELTLTELAALRAKSPKELEIESFVHGAVCVSFSGRCVLSDYMTGRDANRGACAQPCRYRYALVEEKRPGEYFPISEEAGETYILNSRDMCMIDHAADLMAAGINSFKLEGRAKSAYYTAMVTAAYRAAIDAACAGVPLDPIWRGEVERVSHRPYSTGFYFGYPGQYTGDSRYIRTRTVTAVVESCGTDGVARLSLRNKLRVGDCVELVGPGLPSAEFVLEQMWAEDGTELDEARVPQMLFQARLPQAVPPLSMLRIRT